MLLQITLTSTRNRNADLASPLGKDHVTVPEHLMQTWVHIRLQVSMLL
jgi:hypothetical protein